MICLDTHIVIWGVQGKAREGQEHMVAKTKRYINFLEEKKKRVMIPAPVAGEYLIKFSNGDRTLQQELIQRHFFVPALDLPAAAIQAKLEADRELMRRIQEQHGIDRHQLRVDAQIIGVAISNRAEKIVSHDPHMRDLANGMIPVEEIPDIPEQMILTFPTGAPE